MKASSWRENFLSNVKYSNHSRLHSLPTLQCQSSNLILKLFFKTLLYTHAYNTNRTECLCNKNPNETAIELVKNPRNGTGDDTGECCAGDNEVFISSKKEHKCCCSSPDAECRVITCKSFRYLHIYTKQIEEI